MDAHPAGGALWLFGVGSQSLKILSGRHDFLNENRTARE